MAAIREQLKDMDTTIGGLSYHQMVEELKEKLRIRQVISR